MVSQFEVYDILKSLKKAKSITLVKEIERKGIKTKKSYVSEKLKVLFKYKLVTRKKVGKEYIYSIK